MRPTTKTKRGGDMFSVEDTYADLTTDQWQTKAQKSIRYWFGTLAGRSGC